MPVYVYFPAENTEACMVPGDIELRHNRGFGLSIAHKQYDLLAKEGIIRKAVLPDSHVDKPCWVDSTYDKLTGKLSRGISTKLPNSGLSMAAIGAQVHMAPKTVVGPSSLVESKPTPPVDNRFKLSDINTWEDAEILSLCLEKGVNLSKSEEENMNREEQIQALIDNSVIVND